MIKDRPFAITLICIVLLAYGSWSLVKSFEYLKKDETQEMMALIPLPVEMQVALYYVNLVTLVVCGIFILEEKNWARWLFIVWSGVYLLYRFCFGVDANIMLISEGLYVLFSVVLVLPGANRYFSDKIELAGDD